MMRVVPPLPAIEGLGRDSKITTRQAGVAIMQLVVIEPLEPFPGFLREYRDTGQALISRYLTAHVHSAAIIASLHELCVTKVSELEQ